MIKTLLSGDLPRSWVLSVVLAAILATLALAPFLFGGAQAINTAAKVCVFIVLVASYDLLLGYTGIVSFAHTMFYGLGGYGVGLALYGWGATWTAALTGLAIALVAGIALAFAIGLFSLRVRAIFFAMVTLAVASAFAILAAQLSDIHRRRGRPLVPRAGGVAARLHADRHAGAGHGHHRAGHRLLHRLLLGAGAVPDGAAGRQLAVRARAAGDPRERLPRRGARLPHGLLPHDGQLPGGRHGGAGRRAQRACGCATRDPTPRCPSPSCSTSC